MISEPQPILVAACGNVMAGDDAFGPLVADLLRGLALPHVEVVDLGMKPAGLLNHLGNRRALIVVDAALPGPNFPAGSLIDIDFYSPQRPQLLHDATLSSHGLSISHELELAKRLDMLAPRVYLVAAAAIDTTIGQPHSAAFGELVQPAAERIVALAKSCLSEAHWAGPLPRIDGEALPT